MAFSGDPTGEAEEAPLTLRGKRSLLRKSIAVLSRPLKKRNAFSPGVDHDQKKYPQ
jgi:hypothetical protein